MSETSSRRAAYAYDPNYIGFSAHMYALGGAGTYGRELPAFAGCHLLYWGLDTPQNIDWNNPIGAVAMSDANPNKIAPYPYITLPANSKIWFGLRAVGRGGLEEQGVNNLCFIETDGSGVPKPLAPNPPIKLQALTRAGGKILLLWEYNSLNQQIAPSGFKIYHNNGSGAVDYNTPIATVTGRSFLTDAYPSGTLVTFGIRSYAASGGEESNVYTKDGLADSTGPDDVGPPTLELGIEL